jgi:hypothetical protein
MPGPEQPKEISPEMMKNFNRTFLPIEEAAGPDLPKIKQAPPVHQRLDEIEEKIDRLSAKLDRIFGNSVLLKGQFIDL